MWRNFEALDRACAADGAPRLAEMPAERCVEMLRNSDAAVLEHGALRARHLTSVHCRTALSNEVRRLPMWQQFGGKTSTSIHVLHDLRSIYVVNQKAASSYIEYIFKKGVLRGARQDHFELDIQAGAAATPRDSVHPTRDPRSLVSGVAANYTVWTFARDPFDRLLAGFLTVLRSPDASRILGASVADVVRSSCEQRARIFGDFILRAAHGIPSGGLALGHVWPQALHLATLGLHAFDFVGDFELLCDELWSLLRSQGASTETSERMRLECAAAKASATNATAGFYNPFGMDSSFDTTGFDEAVELCRPEATRPGAALIDIRLLSKDAGGALPNLLGADRTCFPDLVS